MNWYAYASNNPVMFVDPSGLIDIIFYGPDQEDEVEVRKVSMSAEEIENTQFYYIENAKEFYEKWNTMGVDENGNKINIENVYIHLHGQATYIEGGKGSKIYVENLKRHTIDTILLTACHKETRRLTDDEIQKVLSLDMPLKTRCFIKLLLCCGLRRGEAWAIEKCRIDIETQKLYIKTTVYLDINDKRRPKIGKPKTKCSIRVLPIPEILVDDLKMYMEETEGLFLFDGELMSEYKFRRIWEEFKELYMHTYNIEEIDFKPHMFRHTYTSILYGAEVDKINDAFNRKK